MSDSSTKSEPINTGGRKPLYKPEYCEQLKEHLSKGYSITSFGGVVGVTTKTIYEWFEKYPEFKEAKQIGVSSGLKFFEDRLMAKVMGNRVDGIKANEVCTSSLIFALKTRFHKEYSEKQQIEQKTTEKRIVEVKRADDKPVG